MEPRHARRGPNFLIETWCKGDHITFAPPPKRGSFNRIFHTLLSKSTKLKRKRVEIGKNGMNPLLQSWSKMGVRVGESLTLRRGCRVGERVAWGPCFLWHWAIRIMTEWNGLWSPGRWHDMQKMGKKWSFSRLRKMALILLHFLPQVVAFLQSSMLGLHGDWWTAFFYHFPTACYRTCYRVVILVTVCCQFRTRILPSTNSNAEYS